MNKEEAKISLSIVKEKELPEFKRRIQVAFKIAVVETFGEQNEPIPSDRDLEQSFCTPGVVIYNIMRGEAKVGGAVLCIDSKMQDNSLDFFFIDPQYHSNIL